MSARKRPLWHNQPAPGKSRPPLPDAVRRRLQGSAPWWLKRLSTMQKTEGARPPHTPNREEHRNDD
jgi:hypothetical protein